MNKYLYIAVVALTSFVLALGSWKIYTKGQESIQKKWDIHEANRTKEILELEIAYSNIQQEFGEYIEHSRSKLQEQENAHKKNLAAIRDAHARGLRDSEERARVYKRHAEEHSNDCGNLADYAGRLDRSIVDGRKVVGGLVEALRRRNYQVDYIGNILIEEQKLFNIGD